MIACVVTNNATTQNKKKKTGKLLLVPICKHFRNWKIDPERLHNQLFLKIFSHLLVMVLLPSPLILPFTFFRKKLYF